VGKYRPGFQWRITGIPVPDKKSTYHKQAGAALAWARKQFGGAFAVAGHHGGLPDLDAAKSAVKGDCGEAALAEIWSTAVADCPALADLDWPRTTVRDKKNLFDLETRVLFSCLVDADWEDTAEHDRLVRNWPAEPKLKPLQEVCQQWLENVLATIQEKANGCKRPDVAAARDEVLRAALVSAAESPPGFFALAVPTGGGKTLTGLAFALRHAKQHGLRRIIYVAPYLSIIDQNGRAIREALHLAKDAPEVFEHHSLSDPSPDSDEGDDQQEDRRAAAIRRAENWDAPVVVTTNVQFLESLFANDPGRCRKLHNIARSVVILDECQAIPNDLLAPTCAMLLQLVEHLGCSIVSATATQPTFDHPELHARQSGIRDVRQIVSLDLDLFRRLRRVQIEWPRSDEYLDWNDIAKLMTEGEGKGTNAALCVVNTRRAARELFGVLKDLCNNGVFHLSTWMCPAHRLGVVDEVKACLKAGKPCYLISTQLIEAGVDVDFPLVLREMAPLEAIIQAAGRCNREGLLNGPDGSPGGRVIVFRSRAAKDKPKRYYPPDPWYVMGRDVLENHFLSLGRQPSIDDPEVINSYFRHLLNIGELDQHDIGTRREEWNFPEVARRYRLIEEGGQPVVVASWTEHMTEIDALIEAVRERPTRSRFRALSRFQVNLRFPTDKQLSFVSEGPHGLLVWSGGYQRSMGLWDELLAEQTMF
jgi:CRISPR-associated endonuclease/helicase Cas3